MLSLIPIQAHASGDDTAGAVVVARSRAAGLSCVLVALHLAGCAGGSGLPGLGAVTGSAQPPAAAVAASVATTPAPAGQATSPGMSAIPVSMAATSTPPTSTLPAQVGLQPAAQAESSGITPAILTAAIPSVLLKSDRMFSTTPTETYALVARGATRCWFGAGPLRRSHVFHADADSPLQGGRALIFVHERDTTADQPRGIKAYRIEVAAGTSGGSLVEQENLRFSAPVAEAMQRDVARWAGGDVACGALPIETGVLPAMPAQPIVAKTATTKAGRTATGNKAVATSTINR